VVPLLEHGLVHDLRKALAAVRAPDDVMAEAYSEVVSKPGPPTADRWHTRVLLG